MRILTPLLVAASLLTGTAAWAQPVFGISLQPVRTVTTDESGKVTVLGNMPGRKQLNQARFPAAVDSLGCKAVAEQAATDGSGFTILGQASGLYAEQGKFTMEFTTIVDCYLF